MPGRFQFQNVGSAAVDELTRVLAEREAKRRQDFLDEMTLRRESRTDDVQRESLKSLQEQRDAANEQKRQAMATGVAGLLKPGQNIDANTADTLKQGNLGILMQQKTQTAPAIIHPAINPDLSVSGGTPGMQESLTSTTFTGTPEQIKVQEQKQALEKFMNDPNTPADVKSALQYEMTTGRNAPAGMFDKTPQGGIVGEYEYYVKQETAAGRKPKSFVDYQNEDANRKKPASPMINIYPTSTSPTGETVADPVIQAAAEYRVPPLSPRSMATPAGKAWLDAVLKVNPDYDATQYSNRNKTRTTFTSGPIGQSKIALNTAIGHLDQLAEAATALNNGDFTPANRGFQMLTELTGGAAPTNFDGLREVVATEIAKANHGGVPDKESIVQQRAVLARYRSPEQLAGYIKTMLPVLVTKANNIDEQYHEAMGVKDPWSVYTSESLDVLKRNGINPKSPHTPVAVAGSGGSNTGAGVRRYNPATGKVE